jgi:hypothetical protein
MISAIYPYFGSIHFSILHLTRIGTQDAGFRLQVSQPRAVIRNFRDRSRTLPEQEWGCGVGNVQQKSCTCKLILNGKETASLKSRVLRWLTDSLVSHRSTLLFRLAVSFPFKISFRHTRATRFLEIPPIDGDMKRGKSSARF